MKKLLLLAGTIVSLHSYSQITLFQDDFESGSGNWTLNSNELGASYISNHWAINNTYVGGTGTFNCLGFDFPFIVSTTSSQTGGISSANGNYMHISSFAGETGGITNANFIAADGLCNNDETYFSKMTNAISTTGYTNVTFSFWNLIGGETGTVVGEVYYSTDNGTSWTLKTGNINSVSAWANSSLTDASWDNLASLKFGFRFVNTAGNSPADPSFSIDDVKITGTQASTISLATGAIPNSSFCSNSSANISVNFTATGTVNSGNQYIARLSDASGSFASPLTIGTLISAATGGLSINVNIPSGLPAGTGYKIRVDASDPNTVGTASSTTLTISSPPTVTFISLPASGVICSGQSATIQASGGNMYMWSPAGSLSNSNTSTVSANPTVTTTYTVLVTAQTGCSATGTFTLQVDNCASLTENSAVEWALYPNPANSELSIQLPENGQFSAMRITDLSGRTVQDYPSLETKIDLTGFQSGSYMLLLSGKNGTIQRTFIKQ